VLDEVTARGIPRRAPGGLQLPRTILSCARRCREASHDKIDYQALRALVVNGGLAVMISPRTSTTAALSPDGYFNRWASAIGWPRWRRRPHDFTVGFLACLGEGAKTYGLCRPGRPAPSLRRDSLLHYADHQTLSCRAEALGSDFSLVATWRTDPRRGARAYGAGRARPDAPSGRRDRWRPALCWRSRAPASGAGGSRSARPGRARLSAPVRFVRCPLSAREHHARARSTSLQRITSR